FQLDEARRAARQRSSNDVEALLSPCPTSQAEIFVVPVRYALAEAPLAHPMCPPVEPLASHAMAARRLRCGYLYAWHHDGPLKRYAVAVDGLLLEQPLDAPAGLVEAGSLRGLALDKHEEAWLCFSEHPIGPAQCAQLGAREVRAQYMRHIDLRRVANTLCAPHCPPLADAEQVMGELMPAVYSAALAVEFARDGAEQRRAANAMGDEVDRQPTDENIQRYHAAKRQYRERRAASQARPELDADSAMPGAWSAERWDAIGVKNWLEQVRLDAESLYPVFACLDDEFGVLRDINHEQAQVQAAHEQWLQDHGLRLQVGGFVRSLLEESASELAGIITYRYREQDIQLTRAQGETLLKAHRELDDLLREETFINHHTRRQYGDKRARAELYALANRKATCLHPVRAFIPPALYNEIEAVVREYRAEKVENLNKWNGPQVADYIDLPAMNAWLEQTAPAHFEQLRVRQELLLKDRGRYLYQHQRPSWFIATDDLPTRRWLDDLAIDCLSEQCQSKAGADQYAEYVRSTDQGILRQLFFAWTVNLEGSLVSASRLGEIEAALALGNRDQAVLAMYKLLLPISREVMHELTLMGGPQDTKWSLLVNRLGAAVLSLGKGASEGAGMSPAWVSLMVMARLSIDSPLRWVSEGGQRTLRFVGGAGQALGEWTQRTAMGIKLGKVANITNA
ncbi:hypothetical protein DCO48_22455, partial [Pseudomonas sp. SDI]|uniref:toxin VasX n=1 Tax=Pseudomonas sp. SDI TaxID=2170734 RepID=UPI000DE62E4D